MTYNVEAYLAASVERYAGLLPHGTGLKKAATPFLGAAEKSLVSDLVSSGASMTCPWCKHSCPAGDENKAPAGTKKVKNAGGEEARPPPRGQLAEKAASVLMQVLDAARYARFDLLCVVAKLAQRIATWGRGV